MRNKTIRFLSKIMCLVLVAGFVAEAPLFAAAEAIKVNVGGQTVNVTPGQWITVKNGPVTSSYNVRYVNGQPVALETSQYMNLVFGSNNAGTAATTQSTQAGTTVAKTSTPQVNASVQTTEPVGTTVAKTSTPVSGAANANTSTTATTQAPTTSAADSKGGSWIKNELSEYGSKIKDSFTSGKQSGNEFGTKTYEGAKSGVEKVGTGVKGIGSKIGDLLRGAKDRIAKIFHKNPTPAKGSEQSGQSGQTGQSEQSGQSGQSGQSEQSGQSGQTGQNEQAGQTQQNQQQAGQTSGQSGQSGQSTQSGDKPGFWDKTKAKLSSGYQAGKAMTNAGVQNVKDSLKSGFSPKNLLMTAGITVGVDLATQIIKGEKPSLKKALKTVCCAEFAGGVVGSVTGAAAGSFFVPFLSAVPVVGGVLSALAPTFGSVVGGSVGAYLAGDLKNGRFSIKEAFKHVDWVGVAGQTVGSVVGTMVGSMIFPPFGTIIGGIVGGMAGNWIAHKIAGLFGKGQSTGYDSVALPTGTNPYSQSQVGGSVTIGGVAAGSEIAVSGDQSSIAANAPSVEVNETIGNYSSEVQLAYAKYQELYRLYNEMVSQGRQADALKVAQEMNKAKGEFEALKAKSGK